MPGTAWLAEVEAMNYQAARSFVNLRLTFDVPREARTSCSPVATASPTADED
jgi:hypothetical protein